MSEMDYTPRVLVVDDEEGIRKSIHMILSKEGFEVVQARDGQEAIDLVSEGPGFDVILSDIKMPKVDGLDLLRWIANNEVVTSVVMLSVHTDLETAVASVKIGAYNYLAKPAKKQDLIEAVKDAAANTRGLKELLGREEERKKYEHELESTVKTQTDAIREMMSAAGEQTSEDDLRELMAKIERNIAELSEKTNTLIERLKESEGVMERKLKEVENYVVGQIQTLKAQMKRELKRLG